MGKIKEKSPKINVAMDIHTYNVRTSLYTVNFEF